MVFWDLQPQGLVKRGEDRKITLMWWILGVLYSLTFGMDRWWVVKPSALKLLQCSLPGLFQGSVGYRNVIEESLFPLSKCSEWTKGRDRFSSACPKDFLGLRGFQVWAVILFFRERPNVGDHPTTAIA